MDQMIATAMSFPTVVLTTLVGLSLLYWLMVILGALDIDLAGDGHGVDVDAGGHVEAGGHGHADAGHHADGHGGGASFLSAIGFCRVPLTISLSMWWLIAWLVCLFGNRLLDPVIGAALPGWALASIVMVGALIVTIPITNLATGPLAPLFVIHEARGKRSFIGQTCVIKTGRVDREFGHADIVDGGDHLIVEVRCDMEGRFERGDKALIIDFDEARDAYIIEPMDAVLAQGDDHDG